MFIKLSDGTILNLDHVTDIPNIPMHHSGVYITMINGNTRNIDREDAIRIRTIFHHKMLKDSCPQ